MTIKCYVARGMTGVDQADLVADAKRVRNYLEGAGFEVLDPVKAENIKSTNKKLRSSKKKMDSWWARDKRMIREAHIIFVISPHLTSQGVTHEIGYARYFLWKKVIQIFPPRHLPPEGSVAYYEDDYITDNLIDAVMEAYRTHGTFWRRLKWRLSIYLRCYLRALWYRLLEWK